jgi:predicted DNA-binding protein (MmcQ/YjbR family)
MTDSSNFQKLALTFPGTEEHPHFEKKSFRVKKKIWATLDILNHRVCLKLSPIDQSVFCAYDKAIIYPADNKWGQHGWTMVELSKIKNAMLKDISAIAYKEVAGKKTSKK